MGLLTRLIAPSRPVVRRARAAPAAPVSFTIDLDGQVMTVRVRRHPRARKLRLRYDAALGELRLVMPPRGSVQQAQLWVAEQSDWIRRQMTVRLPAVAVGPGTQLPWRDGSLLVDWSPAAPRAPQLADGVLRLGGPESAVGPRVRRWLEGQARMEFTAASQMLAQSAGLSLAGVSVGDPRSRWGSCSSSRQIRYSWRLVMAPDHVRTAIVAHEVAHLAHMNHGPDFYALVEQLCGDAHDRSRHWLKQHGTALHRWRFDPG